MEKRNADVRRYLRELQQGMPCMGKRRRDILNQITETVNGSSGADYETLVARFGTPSQIISSYVQEMDAREITCGLKIRKRIIGIVLATVVLLFLVWIGVVYSAMSDHLSSDGGYIVEEFVEVSTMPNERGE